MIFAVTEDHCSHSFLLSILVLPQEGPKIEGSQSRYEVGDYVNVTCKSGPSKPGAVLKWYINGKEVKYILRNIMK